MRPTHLSHTRSQLVRQFFLYLSGKQGVRLRVFVAQGYCLRTGVDVPVLLFGPTFWCYLPVQRSVKHVSIMVSSNVALTSQDLVFYQPEGDPNEPTHRYVSIGYSSDRGVMQIVGEGGGTEPGRLTNLADPQAATDALSAGFAAWKSPVRCASEAAIAAALSGDMLTVTAPGTITIGGVAPALEDRVLLRNQSPTSQNGIYRVFQAGEPLIQLKLQRAHDFTTGCSINGTAVVVREGTYMRKVFVCVADVPDADVAVGTTGISFNVLTGDFTGIPIEGSQIVNASIPLNKLALVADADMVGGGRLMYFVASDPDDAGHGAPASLPLGTQHLPLVAGATNPAYAQLTAAGIADNTITGDKLVAGIYRDGLSVGNDAEQEYITFGSAHPDPHNVGSGSHAVAIHVDGSVRVSATSEGGSFVGTWRSSSDEKWKELQGPVSQDPLADLDKVQSETWTWKPGFHFRQGTFGAGIVAQQFQLVCPQAVTYSAEQDGLVVDYHAVHSFHVACTKALKQENTARAAEIAALQKDRDTLQERNAALSATVDTLSKTVDTLSKAVEALLEARRGTREAQ